MQKRYDAAAEGFARALALNPGDDTLLYALASTWAHAGRPEEAQRWLARLEASGSHLVPLARDFPGVPAERLSQLDASARARTAASRSRVAFTVPDRHLTAEGIAYDAKSRTFFVGSIHQARVLAVGPDGAARDFLPSGTEGLYGVLGMKVDAERRVLWVASVAESRMRGLTPELKGRSALHKVDVDSGRVLARFAREEAGASHLLNDIAVGPSGEVYVTNSTTGELLRLPAGAGTGTPFEVVAPARTFIYPNGLALSPDGRLLYVADWSHGLTAVRTDTGERTTLRHPRGMALRDIDGMAFHAGGLVAVQNGTALGRIVHFALSTDGLAVEKRVVLEENHPLFDMPTTGVMAGDTFYVIANSQLLGFDEKTCQPLPEEKLAPLHVLAVPVSLH
jgi:sugar lactone lactonase YvrE